MFEYCMIIFKNNTQDMIMGTGIATETDTDIDTDTDTDTDKFTPTLHGQF